MTAEKYNEDHINEYWNELIKDIYIKEDKLEEINLIIKEIIKDAKTIQLLI